MKLALVVLSAILVSASHPALACKECDKKKKEKHSHHREHHAHEHGSGELQLVLDGPELVLNIKTPADDIVGFEYAPKTEAEKKKGSDAYKLLTDVSQVVKLNPEAGCVVSESKVEGRVFPENQQTVGANEDSHSEVSISYTFKCERPDVLKNTEIVMLDKFKGLKKLKVQSVVNGAQKSGQLNIKNKKVPGL